MNIITWLVGIWSAGLGGRLLYSLLIYDYIIIPRNHINIFFDFVPLFAFGVFTVLTEVKKGISEIYGNKNAPFVAAPPRFGEPQRDQD
jgi:hypothetical protein